MLDLAELGFDPVMSLPEWNAYRLLTAELDEITASHSELLLRSEILVFVYPCANWGIPALLKGWLERVFVPGVAFGLNEHSARIEGRLDHVRHLVGISTYAMSRWQLLLLGDAGRRTVVRSLRMICSWRTRSTWLGFYGARAVNEDRQRAFLDDVDNLVVGTSRRRVQ